MADNPEQINPEPVQSRLESNPDESVDDSSKKSSIRQPIVNSPDKTSTPSQLAEESPVAPYLDEYIELHYQFTKFRQKPIIRVSAWVDRHIPENGIINRFLYNLIASLSILKSQGVRALFQKIRFINKRTWKGKKVRNNVALDSLNINEYFELNPDISEAILRQCTSNPTQQPDIIIFSFIEWEFRIQRPQHLSMQLANLGHRVYYIQANFSHGKNALVKKVQESVFVVRLPQGNSSFFIHSTLSKDNIVSISASISNLVSAFNIQTAIIKVDLPFWQHLAIKLHEELGWKLVYDCMDEHVGYSYNSELAIEDEHILISKCDLILYTSQLLIDKYTSEIRNAALIQNGTDYELFHTATQLLNHEKRSKYKQPVIGYYGAIADWFDSKLVKSLASAHPEWTFILIGSTDLADIKPLHGQSNVHLLGEKSYDVLPAYLSVFDVCIIPFIQNSLTDATNPVKLYEFLSAGKPVVATRLAEISKYGDFIRLARTLEEWESAIKECLSEKKSDELLFRRYEFARSNTWKIRAEALESELIKLFPKISIIIVTYNKLEYSKMCLESIIKNTDYPNYEIIIVDNASVDGTVDFLEDYKNSHKNISFICNHTNLGFAAANNLGVNSSKGDYLVILNNDTIITPGWLNRLLFHLQKNPSAGMVGPVTNAIGNEAQVEVDYTELTNINYFAAKRADKYSGMSFEIQVLALYCSMISHTLYNQLCGLDERFHIGMFEDDDLALKIKQAGYILLCAKDVFVHHFHGVSFDQFENKELHRIFQENRLKFEQKWGITWVPHQNRPSKK